MTVVQTRFWKIAALALTLTSLVWNTSFGHAKEVKAETVQFELPRAPLTPFQKMHSPEAQNLPQGTFSGLLRVPQTDGPHPAMVVIRTCHDESYFDAWIKRMNDWGYATLSFSRCQPPGFVPDDADMPALHWKRGPLASFGALQFLAARPEIDKKRIGIMSWSLLGQIPLSVIQYEGFSQFFENQFSASVALYPFCAFVSGHHRGPVLVVGGAKDKWVNNSACKRMARRTQNYPFKAKTVLLDNAVHGFDIPQFGKPRLVSAEQINPDRFSVGGGVLGYDEKAAQEAIVLVKSFLDENLKH